MAIDDNTSYELTGYQVKDLASKIRAKADSNSLASVATSGLYSDLTGAPTIPTVYNGTLTIQQNGTQLGTFSANQSSDTTINITGGGGTTYTAGNGINIDANNEISIDDTVVAEVSDLPTDFTGATTQQAGTAGLVPAPTTSDINKYLSSDGSWASISDRSPVEFYWYNNDLYTDNLMGDQVDPSDVELLYRNRPLLIDNPSNTSFESVISINGGGTINAVVMNHSSSDMVVVQYQYDYGNAVWTRSETNVSYTAGSNITISNGTISATDTTYSNFTGATSSVAGANGLVPAPAAGDQEKVLHGDGTWKDTTAKLVEMSYGETNAWAKFIAAYNAGSIVYCRASSNANPGTGSQTRKAFMAYVNNATNPTNVEFQYVRSQSSKSDSQQCDQVFVYTLTNTSGGTWSVASRNMGPKIVAGTGMSSTFTTGANATITLNAEPDYSTSEVDTKVKWIDGKTIYRKTINFGSLPDATSKVVAHGVSNLSKVIKMEGYAYRSGDGTFFPIPFASENAAQNSIALTAGATDVVINTGMNRSNIAECYITIYYTKSS